MGALKSFIIFSNATFTTNLWSRGVNILTAVLNYLVTNTSLAQAKVVLTDGCSAGGHSSYHHLDRIASYLRHAEVRGMGDAGFFLDSQIVLGNSSTGYTPGPFYYRSLLKYYFEMHNGSAGVNPLCLQSKPPELAYECATSKEAILWLERPVFLVQSDFDSYQMLNHMAPFWLPGVDATWLPCTGNVSKCSPQQVDYLEEQWMVSFRGALAEAGPLGPHSTPNGPNGLFLHSCFQHCQLGLMHKYIIDGDTMYQALTKWWTKSRGEDAVYMWVDCIGVECNPTC